MRRVKVICLRCAHQEVVEVLSQEEAREKKIRLVSPHCSRCLSTDVVLEG